MFHDYIYEHSLQLSQHAMGGHHNMCAIRNTISFMQEAAVALTLQNCAVSCMRTIQERHCLLGLVRLAEPYGSTTARYRRSTVVVAVIVVSSITAVQ